MKTYQETNMVIKKGWVSPEYEINEWDLEEKIKKEEIIEEEKNTKNLINGLYTLDYSNR